MFRTGKIELKLVDEGKGIEGSVYVRMDIRVPSPRIETRQISRKMASIANYIIMK